MKIPVKGSDGQVTIYRLWFKHINRQPSGRMKMDLPRSNEDWAPRHTICSVEAFTPSGEWLRGSAGSAVCSDSDDFVKEKGRKVALARAIRHLPRDTRACIWAGYFNRAYLSDFEVIKMSRLLGRPVFELRWDDREPPEREIGEIDDDWVGDAR